MNKIIKKQFAFTLIELLVVIAIIGILSALIIVGMNSTTQKARIAKSQAFSNSLRNSLMADLIVEWRFDGTTADGSAAIANDVLDTWKNINNGTVANPPTVKKGSNCLSGSCLQFDGSNDYVDFGNNSSLWMGTGDQTVSLWVKFDNAASSGQAEILAFCGCNGGGAGHGGYDIFRYPGTSILAATFSDGSAQYIGSTYLSPAGTLVSNTWYNIVVVFDRNLYTYAYINGERQGAYTQNITSQQGNVQNETSFRIGASDATTNRLAGKMDDVRLYNAAMPTSQIQQNYFVGLNKLLANSGIPQLEYSQRLAELSNTYAKE